MSTKSQTQQGSEFAKLLSFETSDQEVVYEAQMLMFQFISEINKYREMQGVTQKVLAEKIQTSGSYLTQVFRGDKPLNFLTVAKAKAALKIEFSISARPVNAEIDIDDETQFLKHIKKLNTKDGYWCFRNTAEKEKQVYNDGVDPELYMETEFEYDNQAIPA